MTKNRFQDGTSFHPSGILPVTACYSWESAEWNPLVGSGWRPRTIEAFRCRSLLLFGMEEGGLPKDRGRDAAIA